MRNGWFRLLATLTVLALPLAACDTGTSLPANGSVSIQLTDAPGDLQAAVVTISDVYLQGSATEDSASGRVHLLQDTMTTNLLTLSDSVADLVQGATVPSGTYGQLRFVVDGGYIVVDNGDGTSSVYATAGYPLPDTLQATGTLQCPSCAQTGIKVSLPGGLTVNGDQNVVLVDFDVSESYGHEAGLSGAWVMHPALKATRVQLTSSVQAKVQLADSVTLPMVNGQPVTLGDFQAELKGANADAAVSGERVALADPDSNGVYTATFTFVVPGDYTVGLVPPDSVDVTTDPVLPAPVTVSSDQQAAVSATVTSATKTGG
ncbi:MAG: DUF4382 domain-containing protein [Gemmatimonadota bacterium]|jgi:hypothetical protein